MNKKVYTPERYKVIKNGEVIGFVEIEYKNREDLYKEIERRSWGLFNWFVSGDIELKFTIAALYTFKDELTGLNLDYFIMLLEMYSGERIAEKSAIELMTLLNRKDVDIYYKSK